jgi:hypothetical protein
MDVYLIRGCVYRFVRIVLLNCSKRFSQSCKESMAWWTSDTQIWAQSRFDLLFPFYGWNLLRSSSQCFPNVTVRTIFVQSSADLNGNFHGSAVPLPFTTSSFFARLDFPIEYHDLLNRVTLAYELLISEWQATKWANLPSILLLSSERLAYVSFCVVNALYLISVMTATTVCLSFHMFFRRAEMGLTFALFFEALKAIDYWRLSVISEGGSGRFRKCARDIGNGFLFLWAMDRDFRNVPSRPILFASGWLFSRRKANGTGNRWILRHQRLINTANETIMIYRFANEMPVVGWVSGESRDQFFRVFAFNSSFGSCARFTDSGWRSEVSTTQRKRAKTTRNTILVFTLFPGSENCFRETTCKSNMSNDNLEGIRFRNTNFRQSLQFWWHLFPFLPFPQILAIIRTSHAQ